MRIKIFLALFFTAFLLDNYSYAQIPNCDATVPVFNINFSNITQDSTWVSSMVTRSGNCCGTLPPDICVLFIITTSASTVGLTFGFGATCPLPSGSIYFQVDCGSPVVYGDTAWISTPGVHYLTYCKPGNVTCTYTVTAITPQIPTGISKDGSSFSSILPDGTGNHFISLDLLSPASFTLNIFSAEGKKTFEKLYSLSSGNHQILVDTHELDAGIYFLQLKSANRSLTKKLIIAR